MRTKVLVTGASGYLGSVLCEHLLDAGYFVKAVDNLMYGQNSLFHLCDSLQFEFAFGDARDESLLAQLVKEADVIIPLAALVGALPCDQDPWMAESVNFEAIRLLNRLRSTDQLIVYPSTESGYGSRLEGICTEDTPLDPLSNYARTKVNAERELLESPNCISLRLATVFGVSPRMRVDLLVNGFVHAAITAGCIFIYERGLRRNTIHIRDVADCFVYCIEHAQEMRGRAYNVGLDDASLSKEELAFRIKEHIRTLQIVFLEKHDPDKRSYVVSNRRLREAGFGARRSLDDGIKELLKGFCMLGRTPMANA